MYRKQILAMGLSMAMILSAAAPIAAAMEDTPALATAEAAAAEETLQASGEDNAMLAEVTRLVKGRLGIGDEYTQFYGDYSDYNQLRYYNLNWSNEDEEISVTCDARGVIYDYYYYNRSSSYSYSSDYAPKFSGLDQAEILSVAESFLGAVLGEGEGYAFQEDAVAVPLTGESRYIYLSGTLTLNGYDTEINFSLSIERENLRVRNYSRYDSYTNYEAVEKEPLIAVSAEEAAALLQEGYSMELRYIISEEDENLAILRYFPVTEGQIYVRAEDGSLYDLADYYDDALESAYDAGGGAPMATAEAAAEDGTASNSRVSLSVVEEEGIAKMDGVLSREEADAIVRGIGEFGIGNQFSLDNISYSLDQESGDVTATLRYVQVLSGEVLMENYGMDERTVEEMLQWGESYSIVKTAVIDGKTGELKSLYTRYPYISGEYDNSVDMEALQATAEAFLGKYFAEEFAQAQLSDSSSNDGVTAYSRPLATFAYARYANQVPCYENSLSITVNRDTGFVDAFSCVWNDELRFEETDGAIGQDAAKAAYLGALETQLIYITIPTDYSGYYGYSYGFLLSYGLKNPQGAYAVEAKTGALVTNAAEEDSPISYEDLAEGSPYWEAATALAACGIGYTDGALKADEGIDLRQLLTLLLQAGGSTGLESYTDEGLINAAVGNGILRRGQYDLSAGITRMELIKMFLDMSGYAKTASLSGIYAAGFTDDSAIPAEDYGYAAIAKGMGLVEGDTFGAGDMVSRGEALLILYNFMNRSI